MLRPNIVLPDPDSPTIAIRSPGLIVKSMPLTTAEYPLGVGKLTCKFFTSMALIIEIRARSLLFLGHLNLRLAG